METILEKAIMEMGRQRQGNNFCPSEIVRWLYPQHWKKFMPDIQQEMMRLHNEGKIMVMQKGEPVEKGKVPKGPVRIKVFR
ncbi:DUF3253 domain-containing protein [Anditalea andensis]|uniref:DUF3253 domain-containing protein n=1 Tax=Anditalea andensis TaxID=1048983 RepID=A0A074KYD6_9BACT|nr:DUF3253 domain-containing protein [Anditalea andensis]KEO73969.1 hypothetical protein EL17_07390 [Anditalea andensis]